MRVIVFAGPSLSGDVGVAYPDIDFRPPARQGDVYRAVADGADAIGIVDGYFEGVPSVWHKEILFALHRGVRVFGAASMGALRAAEMDAFGMVGIGAIYDAYRDGALEDDDEVAVLHGPAEAGWPSVTVPMVNVRATLGGAAEAGAVDAAEADAVIARAKAIHYKDRTWRHVLEGRPVLADWVAENGVDLKRRDAVALLDAIRDGQAQDDAPEPPLFAWTFAFSRAARAWDRQAGDGDAPPGDDLVVATELVLRPSRYLKLRDKARLRRLAVSPVAARPDMAALRERLDRCRRELGLFTREALDEWVRETGLDERALQRLMEGDAMLVAAEVDAGTLVAHLAAEMKFSGDYRLMKAFADARRGRTLLAHPVPPPPALVSWFAKKFDTPDDYIEMWEEDFGYEDRKTIYRNLAEHYLYCRLIEDEAE